MQTAMTAKPTDLRAKGFSPGYSLGDPGPCPGCGKSHWIVGRVLAECAFCGTALPLDDGSNERPLPPLILRRGEGGGKVQ